MFVNPIKLIFSFTKYPVMIYTHTQRWFITGYYVPKSRFWLHLYRLSVYKINLLSDLVQLWTVTRYHNWTFKILKYYQMLCDSLTVLNYSLNSKQPKVVYQKALLQTFHTSFFLQQNYFYKLPARDLLFKLYCSNDRYTL